MNGMNKYCGCCQTTKPVFEFAKNKAKKDGLQERCRLCRAEHHQKTKHLRLKPTKTQKRKWLMTSYGLTEDEFNNLLKQQNNKCAICGTSDWGKPSPSIDHCHKTGKVRGLLCNNCNRGLGLLKDSKEIIQNAIKYLKRSRSSRQTNSLS